MLELVLELVLELSLELVLELSLELAQLQLELTGRAIEPRVKLVLHKHNDIINNKTLTQRHYENNINTTYHVV